MCNHLQRFLFVTAILKILLTCFRFLATGESYRSLSFGYRISHSAISTIVPQVLVALQKKLVPLFLPPLDQIDWEQKANEFWKRWGFPNCVASIDAKHVRVVAPSKSGSLYFNYKGFFSVVLLAMVDANCKFVIIDVGSYGKEGDAGIFMKSKLGKLVKDGTLFPPPKNLPQSDILLPHVVVADDAFSLSEHMMKPYSRPQMLQDEKKRIFNYCLSKARRTSENAFGIMSAIFRIYFTPINLKPETIDAVIVVCCCLHNMLRDDYLSANPSNAERIPSLEDLPTHNLIDLAGTGGFAQAEGFQVRSRFTEYFSTHRNTCLQSEKALPSSVLQNVQPTQ